ncbi:metal ABC transporter permease [Verrucomicrobiaceae bacterium N1E253]|uniref:Metal ABC transporter permease n=1 Tax=Oceaniferula marina TaxID=2748318 RepID=A0A851GGS8_9BACT|nr:iron chelate uptake ABC transporter family permease subunit [Oceaniferula marina]NWK56566.1 metal ABC transporter permease [Oceaniferula marina]
MSLILEILESLIPASSVGKAWMAAVLLGVGCGLLGCFVVLRREALMGDAISHAVLPGVVAGLVYSPDRNLALILACAVMAGLCGVGVVRVLERTTRLKPDACLACVLALFFALGLVWQSKFQSETVGVMHFLFGNIGSIDGNDLKMMLVSVVLISVMVVTMRRPLLVMSFDPGFGRALGFPTWCLEFLFYTLLTFAVVVSLQAVGVVLVSAMLITPAASAYLLTDRFDRMLLLSMLLGILSGVIGAWMSTSMSRMPTGPVMTLAASGVFVLVYLCAPRHGVLAKSLRLARRRRLIRRENTLKTIYHILEEEGFSHRDVSVMMIASKRKEAEDHVHLTCEGLQRQSLILFSEDKRSLSLTDSGWRRAMELVRNHRLWELYLTREANYADDHVHEDAEKIEHLLGPSMIRQLEKDLDFPKLDPHGRPIPRVDAGYPTGSLPL